MLTLTDERVKAAIDRYTKKHGGCLIITTQAKANRLNSLCTKTLYRV